MGDNIERQMDVLISLLARRDPGLAHIYRIVTRGKRNPGAYIKAYNSLDSTVGVTEAAKTARVAQPTMSLMLQGWQAEGVVYDLGEPRKPMYKRLTLLPVRLSGNQS